MPPKETQNYAPSPRFVKDAKTQTRNPVAQTPRGIKDLKPQTLASIIPLNPKPTIKEHKGSIQGLWGLLFIPTLTG